MHGGKRMAKELKPIDVTHTPDVLRLAEEVARSGIPHVLRKGNKDIAEIRPVRVSDQAPGSPWLKEAYEAFAPIREELAEKYSGEEIDAAIDQAVKAVRRTNA